MKLTVEKWLQRIADPVIRESALRQMTCGYAYKANSIEDAIERFAVWANTKEGFLFWYDIFSNPPDLLPLSETPIVRPFYQLFKHMADNHGLILLDTELSDIVDVVKGMGKQSINESDEFKGFM